MLVNRFIYSNQKGANRVYSSFLQKNQSMNVNEFITSGLIDKNGNMLLPEKWKMDSFTKGYLGKRILIKIEVLPEDETQLLIAYYEKKILPEFQKIFSNSGDRLTIPQTDLELRQLSPMMRNEIIIDSKYSYELKTIYDCDKKTLVQFIDHIKQIASEHFNFAITD